MFTFFKVFNKDLRAPPPATQQFVRMSYEAATNEESSGEKLQTCINV